jgi:type I restriction enzyme, S subunit
MSELPEGWTNTTLGEICSKPQYGWTSKASSQGRIKYVRTTDISTGQINWAGVPYCELEPDNMDKFRVREDDILVSRAGSVGVSFRIRDVPYDAVFASYLIRFNSLDCVLPKYVEYFLNSGDYWRAISEFSAGIAVPNVNASKLAQLEIPLPPINEQRRIVPKLEKLLSRLDMAQARLVTIPRTLKQFRQSVLASACSGRLTEDWRVEHPGAKPYTPPTLPSADVGLRDENYPNNWRVTRLGTLTALVTSGSRGWAKYYSDSGSIFIRAQNINADILNLEDIAFVTLPGGAEGLRTRVRQGDLLVTITGANVTKSALVERPIGEAFVSQHVALVRLADLRLSKFLFYSIINPSDGRKQLQTAAYGQGKPGLNLDNIRDVVVAIPPLAEQQEIVRRVEALFKTADALEARYRKAKAHVDKLTQSILAKAFRGELVPQDPNEEPASILLERIRQVRGLGDEKSEP